LPSLFLPLSLPALLLFFAVSCLLFLPPLYCLICRRSCTCRCLSTLWALQERRTRRCHKLVRLEHGFLFRRTRCQYHIFLLVWCACERCRLHKWLRWWLRLHRTSRHQQHRRFWRRVWSSACSCYGRVWIIWCGNTGSGNEYRRLWRWFRRPRSPCRDWRFWVWGIWRWFWLDSSSSGVNRIWRRLWRGNELPLF
jgi:hypothetical protein